MLTYPFLMFGTETAPPQLLSGLSLQIRLENNHA